MTPSESAPEFNRLAIIGAGLIGSSVARAARKSGAAAEIVLFDADPAVREAARTLNLGLVEETLAEAVSGADCVMVATPVGAVASVVDAARAHLAAGCVLTDVGSVKQAVCDLAGDIPPQVFFVPGHPVAGTEKSGPGAGFAELFEGRWCVLTPLARDDGAYAQAVARLAAFWEQLGSTVEIMEPAHHDLALAVTSHLPHLIAFTLVGAADDLETVSEQELVTYSAGGFRDFTRIAAGDPVMWRDIFLHNREATLEALARFTEELIALQRAIRWGDGDTLHAAFARGRRLRRAVQAAKQD